MRYAIPFAFVMASSLGAAAAPTPGQRCEAAMNEAAGKYAACLQQVRATSIRIGAPVDAARCDATFAATWSKLEAKAIKKGGACPAGSDPAETQDVIRTHAATVETLLAGEGLPRCGNGVVDAVGEECDENDRRGRVCADFGHEGGPLHCGETCLFDTSGCGECTGAPVGGFCWFLGSPGESCDEACTAQGLTYDDPGTRGFAGSGGTSSSCAAVLEAIRPPEPEPQGSTDDYACDAGWGCLVNQSVNWRCQSPVTTGSDAYPGISRACACR